jgi:hypothetical protein
MKILLSFLLGILIFSSCKNFSTSSISKEELLGTWTNTSPKTPIFKIGIDSVFICGDSTYDKYELIGDSLKINYPSYSFICEISLSKDTLTIMSGADKGVKMWKIP